MILQQFNATKNHQLCKKFLHITDFFHISHVESIFHITSCHVENFSTWKSVMWRNFSTWQKFLHRHRLWCLWQISGMSLLTATLECRSISGAGRSLASPVVKRRVGRWDNCRSKESQEERFLPDGLVVRSCPAAPEASTVADMESPSSSIVPMI